MKLLSQQDLIKSTLTCFQHETLLELSLWINKLTSLI